MDLDAALGALRDRNALLMLGVGYLAGSIPFGLIIALVFAKKDVRQAGSGNIGATNVARVVGKKLGIVTLVLDAAKGAIPVVVAGHVLGLSLFVQTAVGLMALVGHCFPIWLKFRGGKGVATGLGVLLAARPVEAGLGLLLFVIAYAMFRLVSAGSLLAAA